MGTAASCLTVVSAARRPSRLSGDPATNPHALVPFGAPYPPGLFSGSTVTTAL
jgi:hypothetical protein